jgi:hypothetical protein
VLFHCAPGRGGEHAERFLQGFGGQFLQVDAYEGYDRLTHLERSQGPWKLVHCWSHLRRRFVKLARNTKSPIAEAAVRQIATLYAVETTVRGAPAQNYHESVAPFTVQRNTGSDWRLPSLSATTQVDVGVRGETVS